MIVTLKWAITAELRAQRGRPPDRLRAEPLLLSLDAAGRPDRGRLPLHNGSMTWWCRCCPAGRLRPCRIAEGLATAVIDRTTGRRRLPLISRTTLASRPSFPAPNCEPRHFAGPEIRYPVLVPLSGCTPGFRQRQARPLVRRWRARLDSMRVDRDGCELSKTGRPKARTVRGLGRLLRRHLDGSATVPRLGGHCGWRGQLRRASRHVSFRPHAARALAPP